MPEPPTLEPDIANQLSLAGSALAAGQQYAETDSKLMCGQAVGLAALHVVRAATFSLGRFQWKEDALATIFDEALSHEAGPELTAIFHELVDARQTALMAEPGWNRKDLAVFLNDCQKFIDWGAQFVAARPIPKLRAKAVTRLALTDLPAETQEFLSGLRAAIREKEPSARLVLYGSRARREERPGSDWDLLVLLDGPVSEDRRRALRVHLYLHPVMLAAAKRNAAIRSELSWQFLNREDWDGPPMKDGSFHWNVTAEGIAI